MSRSIKIVSPSFLIPIEPSFGIMKANYILEDGQSIKSEKVKSQDGDISMFLESMYILVILRKTKEMAME